MPRLPSSISSSLLTCDFFKSQILASQFPVTSPSRNLSLHRLHSWGLSSLRLSPIGQSTTSRNVIISRDSRGASFLQHAQSVRRRRYPPSPPAPLQPPLAPVLPSASPRGQGMQSLFEGVFFFSNCKRNSSMWSISGKSQWISKIQLSSSYLSPLTSLNHLDLDIDIS